jgi:hypothetical protein
MNHLEDELKRAFRRIEPPAGFAGRVMAHVPSGRRQWIPRSWMAAAAAVLMVAGAGSWEYRRARQKRIDAEQAKAELMFALELTASKLQATRSKVLRHTGGSL